MPCPADHRSCLPNSRGLAFAGAVHRAEEVPHWRLVSLAGTGRVRELLHQVLRICRIDVEVMEEVLHDGDQVAGELALEVRAGP